MIRFELRISSELNNWLISQATRNNRSKNQQIQYLLERARRETSEPQYTLDSTRMCSNGHHHYRQAEPAMADFCVCGMFTYGEKLRSG